jgi:hypothetical protein
MDFYKYDWSFIGAIYEFPRVLWRIPALLGRTVSFSFFFSYQ